MESNLSKQSNISNEVPVTENEVLEKVKEAPVQKIETKSSECCDIVKQVEYCYLYTYKY